MNSIINYFDKEFGLTDIEKAKLKYTLDVLFTDVSKLLILFVIFHILGVSKDFIYSVLALLTIRPFTGGLHFKTYTTCFIFTFFFFSIAIILNNIISLGYSAIYLMIFSCIVVLSIAPIIHKNRPGYSNHKKRHFKYLALSVVLLHLILYLIAMANPYLNISIWVITLQSIQLLIRKGVDIYEKINKNFT
ncbi:accessory gene regulator B family protein [Tissierella sp. Yu-01]|uniref:accessory gene regulator B family protein n=1 Tax=Tissierella sp. Yu-01 TaxID=3035694 RepID=UPI00240CFA5F|nr:accessory gene regulator B family protein [Tissierella sp. Yu-01]WFA09982.1 accessory gene regulator B family protein [Tissierella sp. Yu-01]